MMIDWFIKSLQHWYFEHRQTADEHKHELTPWAEAKLAQRIAKSATWTVRPAANYLYNVVDYYKNATVDINSRTCSCGQWQLSGLPCGHLIAVMRHLRQSSANQFAFSCFKTSVWRASYNEVIFDVGHPSEWDQPDGLIIVLPPVMDKRQPGRPRNRDRLRSKGEQITPKSCTRCFKGGHNRRDCPSVCLEASYNEVIFDAGHPSEWDQPDGLIIVLPPVMDKRQPGRPRNRNRLRSKGEQITPKSCTRCFKGGHNRRDCPSVVPSHIFISTTSSVKSGSSWNKEI
nr:hypothetical protein [Tanacetum cinerariifolium]